MANRLPVSDYEGVGVYERLSPGRPAEELSWGVYSLCGLGQVPFELSGALVLGVGYYAYKAGKG